MTKIKENVITIYERIKKWVKENPLRTLGIFVVLVILLGFLMPLVSIGMDVKISGLEEREYEILKSEQSIVTIGLNDFLFQTPVDDLEVFDIPLSDIKIGGVSILEIMRTPFPELETLNWLGSVLNNPGFDYLGNMEVQETILDVFQNGTQINRLMNDLYGILQSARNVAGTLQEMEESVSGVVQSLNAMMVEVDHYKTVMNEIVFMMFFINLLLLIIITAKKVSAWFSFIISAIEFILFAGFGILLNWINDYVNQHLIALTDQFNQMIFDNIRQIIEGLFGNLGNLLVDFLWKEPTLLSVMVNIDLRSGYFVMTIMLFVLSVISFVLIIRERKVGSEGIKLLNE